MTWLRVFHVFMGFCITQIIATLKQPFRRSLLNRITIPNVDAGFNILNEWASSLSKLNIVNSNLLTDLSSALNFQKKSETVDNMWSRVFADMPDYLKKKKMHAPLPSSLNKNTRTRCVNSEVIVAIEAVLLGMIPLAFDLEELSSPVALVELLFFAICNFGVKSKLDVPYEQADREGDRNWSGIWHDVLTSVDNPREWVTTYFIGAKFEQLAYEDVHEWVSWAMFTTTPSYLNMRDEDAVKGVVKQIEDYTSYSFQPRALDAPRFEILRPSIESLRWVHKPLLFYAVTQGVFGMLLSHRMKKHNFVRKTTGEISYWTNADSLQSDKIPIVMAHGIGGLCAYFDFVKALMPLDCPMIVLEIPSVSLHIAPNVPSIDTHVSNVKEILDLHGFEKAVFIGHSFGSSIVSWVVQSLPERVAGSVFLDPVVFMVHLTDILQNWTYEAPVNKVSIEGLMDIVKTELFASHTVQRHFVWHRNILFAHELQECGSDSLVILSGADKIVPSSAVRFHLEKHNQEVGPENSRIQTVYLDDAPHGGIIFHEKYQLTAIEEIGKLVQKSTMKYKSGILNRSYALKKTPSLRNIVLPSSVIARQQ